MNQIAHLAVGVALAAGFAVAPRAHACAKSSDAVAVVQAQVEAYNRHDVEAFIGCYADDVVIHDLANPGGSVKGLEELRKTYAFLATAPKAFRVEIVKRIASGSVVVDVERVHGLAKEKGTPEVVAIYEVRNGKIQNVWFPPSD